MINIGLLQFVYELGGGLTGTVPGVSIVSHFGPPPPPHTYKRPVWILSSALLVAASKGFSELMTRVDEAPSLAQSWFVTV